MGVKRAVFGACATLILIASHADALDQASPLAAVGAAAVRAPTETGDPWRANFACTLSRGSDALLARIHLIRNAQHTIDIQTFIWGGDESSRWIGYELTKAAERGVKVRLLLDFMGAVKEADEYAFDRSKIQNVEIKIYRPIADRIDPSLPHFTLSLIWPNGTNQRMHNKTMVVDGEIGLTGGRNFANEYFDFTTGHNFRDQEILVAGPAVEWMTKSFDAFWNSKYSYHNYDLKDVQAYLEAGEHPAPSRRSDVIINDYFALIDAAADDTAAVHERISGRMRKIDWMVFVADSPGKKSTLYLDSQPGGSVAEVIRHEIAQCTEELLIQSPYIILTRRSRGVFKKQLKANKALVVKLSSNSFGAADHYETYSATFRLRSKLVRGLGFHLYEYNPYPADLDYWLPHYELLLERADNLEVERKPYLSIHSKTFIFDKKRAFVGSFNLDPRSMNLNSECGLIIEDESLVAELRDLFYRDIAPENSWVIAEDNNPLADVNRPFEVISSILPIDVWPLHNMTSFALREGAEPVDPDHPDFYDNYKDVGRFPGSEDMGLEKIQTSFYKTVGKMATPFL